MTQEGGITIDGATVAKLARGVRLREDAVRGQKVLLAPERAMALDEIAVKIVEALDGERSLDRIADDFAAEFGAPRQRIADDVAAFVQELADRRMLEVIA
ncbi:pyrroloquinoline quinone biosynthesis peptide chaperone PqqD [Pararhizobium haloflavum]|uniref:pyrroloquinoline quinone biosynthesis peptide chaperone PqqD n=1 Tax=Pararhizobium haloflavum TaxID=2037914 RepID=UPI000C17686F|nr:pyrroloquinoline quinone biosynthesis peptide chaperone PqqD [Pararhizobium haloflavum]